ncbi:MAG TPA: cysteine desulfurase family protein [Oculatellaceae cyanobacterium]|jgi:cysteine desulfurase
MPTPSSPRIYMDNAATTPVDEAVLAAMLPFLSEVYGNPSSLHSWGREAQKALDTARKTVASCLNTHPESIIFTSGATEANNLVLKGLAHSLTSKGRHIITSSIEHASVHETCDLLEQEGWEITRLPVDSDGFILPDALQNAIRPDTILVSIIHGNNEIGTIQPIEALGKLVRERSVLFHTDAVQTMGKLPFDLTRLPVDYLTLSAHKIYGPKGVGALYIREGAPMPTPLLTGGGQEHDLRSGTENLAGIIGLAKVLELAVFRMNEDTPRIQALQENLIARILETIPNAELNGPRDVSLRVPGNAHFSFPPGEGEALVLRLDLKGIAVSSGSACHSAVIEPSRVVKALGKSDEIARATLRFSLGRHSTQADVDRLLEVLPAIVSREKTAHRAQ